MVMNLSNREKLEESGIPRKLRQECEKLNKAGQNLSYTEGKIDTEGRIDYIEVSRIAEVYRVGSYKANILVALRLVVFEDAYDLEFDANMNWQVPPPDTMSDDEFSDLITQVENKVQEVRHNWLWQPQGIPSSWAEASEPLDCGIDLPTVTDSDIREWVHFLLKASPRIPSIIERSKHSSRAKAMVKQTRKEVAGLIRAHRRSREQEKPGILRFSLSHGEPSKLWYLVPLLLVIPGGLIAYLAVKKRNITMANNLILLGFFTSILYTIIYAYFL